MTRDRRAVVVGGVLILGLLVGVKGVPSVVRTHGSLRARAIERSLTLHRAQETVSTQEMLDDSLAHMARELLGRGSQLVAVGTAAEASAELASLVGTMAQRHGLRVVQIDVQVDPDSGPVPAVEVLGAFEGDVRGLGAFLTDIESGDPLLSVTSLQVMVPGVGVGLRPVEALRVEAGISGRYLVRKDS